MIFDDQFQVIKKARHEAAKVIRMQGRCVCFSKYPKHLDVFFFA